MLDEAHLGDIQGAFGTIAHDDTAPAPDLERASSPCWRSSGPGLIVMVGDNDAGAFGTYTPGRPELRHDAAVDAAAAGAGALRQPGDGAAPRRGDRRRPCAADLRALRQVLGRVQRHRPVPAQRADHRHRIHRHHSRRCDYLGVPKLAGVVLAAVLIMAAASTGRFPPVRALRAGAVCLQPAAGAACLCWCIRRSAQVAHDFLMPRLPQARKLSRRDAAGDRHRRHHRRAVAAVLPAELCDRQAHHAALHQLREGGSVDRHRLRDRSAPSR